MKSGGLFAVFDVVRTADGPIRYPVPWALDDDTSFVADLKNYRDAMESAGFRVDHVLSQKTSAVEATKRAMARMAQDGPPVLGLQLLMGEKTQLMVANVLVMMQDGLLEPVEMIGLAV